MIDQETIGHVSRHFHLKTAVRYCKDIGLWVLDRPRESCKYRTSFCKAKCYNGPLYRAFDAGGNMTTKDILSEIVWLDIRGAELSEVLQAKRKPVNRIRLMTRGEALADISDIERVADIAESMPKRLVMLPTRAWRSPHMWPHILRRLKPIENLRLLCSIDPSTTWEAITRLTGADMSTMFFGNDDRHPLQFTDNHLVKCPKTWSHLAGYCAKCKGGCFTKSTIHVWLKEH